MKTTKMLLHALLFAGFSTYANEYRNDLSLGSLSSTDDFSDGITMLSYRHYFKSINDDKLPKAINDLYINVNSLGAKYTDINDYSAYSLMGRYYFSEQGFVELEYLNADANRYQADGYRVAAGFNVDETTLISVDYQYMYYQQQQGFNINKSTAWTIQAHKYIPLENTAGVNLSAKYVNEKADYQGGDDSDSSVFLTTDWYINNQWRIGLSYQNKADYDFSVHTDYWWQINSNFAVSAGLERIIDSEVDDTLIDLRVTYRF